MSYCMRRSPPPQMIRLIVPGAFPSIRISRACTTVASAIAGLVMAIRVMSNSVESTIDRPVVTCNFGNWAGVGAGTGGAPWAGGACAVTSESAATNDVDSTKTNRSRSRDDGKLISANHLFGAFSRADGFHAVDGRYHRRNYLLNYFR